MTRIRVLALVLAGGEGTRLRPLTVHQAKPAVPFTRGYRIIDFVLANLVNSRVPSICVVAQYKPHTLLEHIDAVWRPVARLAGSTIDTRVPQAGQAPFRGTADAVDRCADVLERHAPDVVAVFAADHIYRMDVRQMIGFHLSRHADVTVAGVPVPIDQASAFGVMATDSDGTLRRFDEKPALPQSMPARAGYALASMGNYLFRPAVLRALLDRALLRGGCDFGKDIMPGLATSGLRAVAYDFQRNVLPGLRPYEERAYWRDVGTLAALEQAREDVEGVKPRFDLRNRAWPIRKDLLEVPAPQVKGSIRTAERVAA